MNTPLNEQGAWRKNLLKLRNNQNRKGSIGSFLLLVGATSKEIIQRELVGEKPQLSIDHLLNPYYYFSEYTLE